MWKLPVMSYLARRLIQVEGCYSTQIARTCYSTMLQAPISNERTEEVGASKEDSEQSIGGGQKYQNGENISRKDRMKFLITTLRDTKDSKEAIYGDLDSWVAWEQNFPIASLKRVLKTLENEQQWLRVVQVIKWILSKGQGNTMGTYGQLLRALDMEHRAEEAHKFWTKRIGGDLHSVPWQVCKIMMSVYYRNNMLENLVTLFKGLEAFDRKPPEKSVVQKVANAYERLGLLQEKDRVLEKYKNLLTAKAKGSLKKSTKESPKKTNNELGKCLGSVDSSGQKKG